jgi:thiamine biosynthesis lipoprotein
MDTLLSPRRRTLVAALGAGALLAGCSDGLLAGLARRPLASFAGPSMGTTWNAKLAGALADGVAARAEGAVASALAGVVDRMSSHLAASELGRFNRHASTEPFAVSRETLEVFLLARAVSEETGGAFDVTVAPAVEAWGFGPSGRSALPTARDLASLASRVDYRHLAIDERAGTLAKARADVRADLSGIAKGYGVDLAARALDALGSKDYLVEAGGEVRCRGANAEGRAWRIGIERPDRERREPLLVVPLAGLSMATSGDYRIFFEHEGRRYSHEIDPATREPVRGDLASVSVACADCGRADALATALFVMGEKRGFEWAADHGEAACFIVRGEDGGLEDRRTHAFAKLGAERVAA